MSITQDQLFLIREIFQSDLPLYLSGGFAEESLLRGQVSESHQDIDAEMLRADLKQVKEALSDLDCKVQDIFKPGIEEVFRLKVRRGEISMDLQIVDWDESQKLPYVETIEEGVHFRVYFGKEMFDTPPQKLNRVSVRVVSPLTLLQYWDGTWKLQGKALRGKDEPRYEAVRKRFFPNFAPHSDKFQPHIVQIDTRKG